ncbi:MAG TPA: PAS domain S-box protein [Pontibacter sp.]
MSQSHTSIEKLMQHSSDLIGHIDGEGYILAVSSACEKIIGYQRKELIGRRYVEFLHQEDIRATRQFVQDVSLDRKPGIFENRFIHKHGQIVSVRWTAAWPEEDGTLYFIGYDITEQKMHQQRLIESEQRYKTLFDTSPDVLFVEDKYGMITEANDQFKKAFGCESKFVSGAAATCYLPATIAPLNTQYLQRALSGETVRCQLEIAVNGKNRTYDTLKHPIIVHDEVIGVQTIAKDITPIVESHEIIKQQARKLNTIFESITDAFLTLDTDWNLTYINKEAERLLNIDRAKHIGENIWSVFPSEKGGAFYLHYHYAVNSGETSHFEAYFEAGAIWVEVKAFPSDEGLSIYFSDISEKKRNRHELEKLSLVASKTNNGVIIADRDYRIEWVNEGFTRLTGYDIAEATGKKPLEFLHCSKTDINTFLSQEDKLNNGEKISFEILNVKKNAEEVWISAEVTALFDEKGERTGHIEVMTDITSLKTSQEELRKLAKDLYRKNNDLQQFTYIVSHNLRAPVANALGLSGIIAKADKASPLFHQSLKHLHENVLQLDVVLKDLSTVLTIRDKRDSLEKELVDIYAVLQQAIVSFQEPLQSCGGTITTDVAAGTIVKANRAYLYSIFHNLLSNAIKYRSDERPLHVTIKCRGESQSGVLLSVSDNGTGFDINKAGDNVFKLYKRFHTDRKGRGIGLYLVNAHLKAMGGHVEVSSWVGVGTRFLIYLLK